MTTLKSALSAVPDHRDSQGRLYSFPSMVMAVILGFMCGCNSLAAVQRFLKSLNRKQREALGFLWWRVPSHSNLCVFFHGMDVKALTQALCGSAAGNTVALDGKRLRGSVSSDCPEGVHVLSCFAECLRAVLGQQRQTKGNEVTAALELLETLDVKDTIITGDAMFAHRTLCEKIVSKGGHYVFTLKDNQKPMKKAAERAFSPRRPKRRHA